MVQLVRGGKSQREVARRFRISLHTVQRWVHRSEGANLQAVDWSDRPHQPHKIANKTSSKIERKICVVRKRLEKSGALGFSGAQTIHETLQASKLLEIVPSVRTIGRILRRHGFMDRPRRVRNV